MSFEEFYNLNFQKIYKFYYYKFVLKDDIEDLVHESFLRFYKKYGQKDLQTDECQKILYGISRNIYKEWVRKAIKEKNVSFLDNYEYEIADDRVEDDKALFESDEPEGLLKSNLEVIKECLDELNETVRKVLECRFLEGKTRKETAELLGIKEKDVHTYQKRGVKYLKKLVESRKGGDYG